MTDRTVALDRMDCQGSWKGALDFSTIDRRTAHKHVRVKDDRTGLCVSDHIIYSPKHRRFAH
jgi:hypothetical protein